MTYETHAEYIERFHARRLAERGAALDAAIEAHPDRFRELLRGDPAAERFFVAEVMRACHGWPNPAYVQEMVSGRRAGELSGIRASRRPTTP